MPLLGVSVYQLLLSFVGASILFKLTISNFFIKLLASKKLVYYLVPSNSYLRKIKEQHEDSTRDGDFKKKHNSKPSYRSNQKRSAKSDKSHKPHNPNQVEVFKIHSSALSQLQLDTSVFTVNQLIDSYYAVELEWVADLSVVALFCYSISQLQFYFLAQNQSSNYSLIWTLLVIGFCLKTLLSLTTVYFKTEHFMGERSLCIIFGGIFLFSAMLVLAFEETYLEFDLAQAYDSFNSSATDYLSFITNSPASFSPISFFMVKLFLAVFGSTIGTLIVFPGLRFGQLHESLINSPVKKNYEVVLFGLNYIAPLVIVCLWIKPFRYTLVNLTGSDTMFDYIRLIMVLASCAFKFVLMPHYVSAFLSSVETKITRVKCRGGMTDNIEIRRIVSSICAYVNIMICQYLLPLALCFFSALLLKTLGEYSWPTARSQMATNSTRFNFQARETLNSTQDTLQSKQTLEYTIMEFKKIFSPPVYRGLLNFIVWWIHFAWFCTSSAGVIYKTHFSVH